MAQNYDLIEVVSTAGESEGCDCSASDFANDFISSGSGIYTTQIKSTDGTTIWSPFAFTLGKSDSVSPSVMTIQAAADTNASLLIKGTNTTTISPGTVVANTLRSVNGQVNLNTTLSKLKSTEFNGPITVLTDSTVDIGTNAKRMRKIYADDLDISGTATLNALILASLTLTSNLEVDGTTQLDGNTTIGNAGTDTLTVNAATTFAKNFTANPSVGNFDFSNNTVIGSALTFSGIVTAGSLVAATATLTAAPIIDNHAVRRTDVNIGTSLSFGPSLTKITVAGGYITAATDGVAASDLPDHASQHHSSTLTSNVPAVGGDVINSYEVGAVTRTAPVVGKPLKLINSSSSTNYTYGDAQDYFVLLEASSAAPAQSGVPGQIIFRKAT